ncbi:MAG: glycosyltransferase family 4 protein [Planctomycetota bacterium]
MKRFAYVCGDPGVPLPGTKGASAHVASIVTAFGQHGLVGTVHAARAESERLGVTPIVPLPSAALRAVRGDRRAHDEEAALFLASSARIECIEKPVDFIYERYSLWHTAGLARARELNVPFVLEVNSPLPEEARRFRTLDNVALANGVAALLLRAAELVFCVSDEVAEWAKNARGDRPGLHVLPNGVDEELFQPVPAATPRPAPLPPAGVPLIVFCGSFRPWHGLDDLLTAFHLLVQRPASVGAAASLRAAHLLLIGDGPERARIEARARELELSDRVHFTGQVPQSTVAQLAGAADVAAAPYPQRLEQFYFSPLKIFEFMALGLPIVSTALGQVSDLLGDGERGLVCAPGDTQQLAASLAHLLSDRAAARAMGLRGRRFVVENATWRQRCAQILAAIGALA